MFLNTILEEPHGELDHSFESDIADQHCSEDLDPDFSFCHEVPSRPCSRLSFNRDTLGGSPFSEDEVSDDALEGEYPPEGDYPPFRPHTSPSSTSTDPGMDGTILTLQQDSGDEAPPPSPTFSRLSGSGLAPNDPCIISDDEDSDVDSDCSSYSDFDDETPSFPSPPSPPPIIHDFSAPTQEPDWSLRPKFSCLPSPLSPSHVNYDPYSFRQNPTRHYYGNHGHSRHALHHLKWFWAAREDEWLEHNARLCASKPYDRLSIFDDVPAELRHPSGRASPDRDATNGSRPPSPRAASPLPPLTIHPRRGDLQALRDPYVAHIDRYFVGMPLWTMSKTLWMFDIHTALEGGSSVLEGRSGAVECGDDSTDGERSPVDRSDSVGFSDDSDSTLVESDNEGDVSMSERFGEPDDIIVEGILDALDEGSGIGDLSPVSSSTSEPERPLVAHLIRGAKPKSSPLEQEAPGPSELPSRKKETDGCWPKSWYRRWEVLLHLCLKDLPRDTLPPRTLASPKSTSAAFPVRGKARKFFIPDDEEDWDEVLPGEGREVEVTYNVGKKKNALTVVTSLSKDVQHIHGCRRS